LANILSAEKRNRQNEKRRLRNKSYKTQVKTAQKFFLDALEADSTEQAAKKLQEVESLVDKAVKKGVFHKNAADRKKSRLYKKLNQKKGA